MCTPLSEATVAIVGLGLMGGSLGMALEGRCKARAGYARRRETATHALSAGAVDSAGTDMRDAVGEADIVVLAMPVGAILAEIPAVAAWTKPGALLIDLGSTKQQVVQKMSALPEHLFAVGGHPMCGSEQSGIEFALGSLYQGATFVLVPTARSDAASMRLASELALAVGACPLELDAGAHDRAAALVSHLPFLLAATLVSTEREAEGDDPAARRLAAGGFRDTTRVAAGDVTMMLDTLLTNRPAVLSALDRFEHQLRETRRLLDEPERLESWMREVRATRREMFS